MVGIEFRLFGWTRYFAGQFIKEHFPLMNCSEFTAEQCTELLAMMTSNQFDPEVYQLVFYSGLKFWAIGLGVGLITSIIRKRFI